MKNILKNYRDRNNLTTEMAGQILGVSQSFYSRIEAGKKPISKKLLDKIITSFNLTDKEMKELKQQQFLIRTPKFLTEESVEFNKKKNAEEKEKKKIGEILKEFRKNNKITGAKLAQMLGCSQQYISQIESKNKPIPIEKLEMLKNLMSETEYSNLIYSINFSNMKNISNEIVIILRNY